MSDGMPCICCGQTTGKASDAGLCPNCDGYNKLETETIQALRTQVAGAERRAADRCQQMRIGLQCVRADGHTGDCRVTRFEHASELERLRTQVAGLTAAITPFMTRGLRVFAGRIDWDEELPYVGDALPHPNRGDATRLVAVYDTILTAAPTPAAGGLGEAEPSTPQALLDHIEDRLAMYEIAVYSDTTAYHTVRGVLADVLSVPAGAALMMLGIEEIDGERYPHVAKLLTTNPQSAWKVAALTAAPTPAAGGRVADLDDLQQRVGEWAHGMFPQSTFASRMAHLRREWDELLRSHEPSEAADMGMILLDIAYDGGFSLMTEIERKFSVVQQRRYGPPDAEGVSEHVRDDAALGAAGEER